MINEFLQSWSLFSDTYIGAILIGLCLSLLGVVVVARGNVFVAAALSQASLFGVAISLFFGFSQPVFSAVLFSVAAAMLLARHSTAGGDNATSEEMTGWIFLLGASLSVLLLARMPYGLKEIQSLFASSIIGVNTMDITIFGGLFLTMVAFLVMRMRRLTLYLSDPVMAAAVGVNIFLWSILIACSLGLATGLAIRSSGMLFTFGCMVLPPQMAKNLCRDMTGMFWVSPFMSLGSIIMGLMIGNYYDLPPAQTVVALMSLMLLLSWVFRWIRESLATQS